MDQTIRQVCVFETVLAFTNCEYSIVSISYT